MSVIDVHRSHTFDKEHAREAAEALARDLASKFELNYQWEGDHLKFKRSGARGHLNITGKDLHVHLELGMLLRPFKSRIAQEIHSQLDQILGA